MKHINKETIIAALLGGLSVIVLTVGGVALAHGGPNGPQGKGGHFTPEKMEAHLAEMTERLDLSPTQEQQIRTIMEQAKAQGDEIKDMPRGKEKFLAMKDLRFTTEDQIYANLSCEQREELRLLKREHKAERMEQRFQRHHSGDSDQ